MTMKDEIHQQYPVLVVQVDHWPASHQVCLRLRVYASIPCTMLLCRATLTGFHMLNGALPGDGVLSLLFFDRMY